MPALLVADHDGTLLSDATARALTAALQIASDVHVLVAGHGVAGVAAQAAALAGAGRVLIADAPALANQLAEPLADLIVGLASGYEAIVSPATALGKSVSPRVAALLDVMQVSEVIGIVAPDTFERPAYAGNAIQTVQATDPVRVITVRGASFEAAPAGDPAPIETLSVTVQAGPTRFVGETLSVSERPELASARVVVSGGRALKSRENFATYVAPVADRFGAAIGASRAAVDAGYAPNDWQVGQTGKVVAPDLYLAAGISGAIQHLAGMKDSRIIVAINSDPDAPIFQIADYGLVEDLFVALPALAAELDRTREAA